MLSFVVLVMQIELLCLMLYVLSMLSHAIVQPITHHRHVDLHTIVECCNIALLLLVVVLLNCMLGLGNALQNVSLLSTSVTNVLYMFSFVSFSFTFVHLVWLSFVSKRIALPNWTFHQFVECCCRSVVLHNRCYDLIVVSWLFS